MIGAVLGNGWYFVTYHRWDYYKPDWMHRPKLLLKLVLKYTDNTIEEVVSDHSWKTQDSAILYNENKRGEIYDAREEIEGWKNPDFDDALCRNTIPTIRVTQKIGAKKLKNNIYELCREVEDKYWDQLADVDRQNLKVLQRYWKK